MKDKYYFGKSLLEEFDFFAFPRTGSHFFYYCLSGLFDLVAMHHEHLENEEAVSRQKEINPVALYALDLREDGVPYRPVSFNAVANGVHGGVRFRGRRFVVLIREPVSSVYSLYRVGTSRWGLKVDDLREWARERLVEYNDFYSAAFDELKGHPDESLLVRYEELKNDPAVLRGVAEFVGLKPKLSPEFVHSMTNFDVFVKGTDRTFYREGDMESWRRDGAWDFVVELAGGLDFARFGYRI
jgi:hypothetical protein